MGTFVQKTEELRKKVGDGELKGVLNVNQIYAYCQHEHWWWNTKHKYLTKALEEHSYFGDIAKTLYGSGGLAAMIKAVEELNKRMAKNAPRRTGALAGSGGAKVFDNGALKYDRAQTSARKPGENKGIAPHRPPGTRLR